MPLNTPAINDLGIEGLGSPTLTLGGGSPTMTPTTYIVNTANFNQSRVDASVRNRIGAIIGRIMNEEDITGTIEIQLHTSGSIPSNGATGSIDRGYAPTGSIMNVLTFPSSRNSANNLDVPTMTLDAFRKLS